jgi:hypothetical protein
MLERQLGEDILDDIGAIEAVPLWEKASNARTTHQSRQLVRKTPD